MKKQKELTFVTVVEPTPETFSNANKIIAKAIIEKYGVNNIKLILRRYEQMKKENLL